MAPKTKRLSLDKKCKITQQLSAPRSSVRQLADWHRRDGEGPVPEVVKKAVERYRTISPEIRTKGRLIISRHKD